MDVNKFELGVLLKCYVDKCFYTVPLMSVRTKTFMTGIFFEL